jgi:hypothetical protein
MLAEWYRSHAKELDGLGWDEFRLMVLEGLDRVKAPLGGGKLAEALAEADRLPLPACAIRYAAPGLQRVVKLCVVLQGRTDPEPFPLAANPLADELRVDPSTVSRWLRLLMRDRVLSLGRRGNRGRANEYRYAGDQTTTSTKPIFPADPDGPYR